MCDCKRCRTPKTDVAALAFEASMLDGLGLTESEMPGLILAVWKLGLMYRASDVVRGQLREIVLR